MSYIRDHLMAFYQHYADENGLSLSQTAARISKWDLSEWKRAVDSMGDMSDWPDEAKNRVKIQSYTAGIDRNHLIGAILALGIVKLTVLNQKNIQKRIESDGKAEVKRMTSAFNLPKKQISKATSVITQPATRELWSRNLWVDSDKLAADVQYLVNQHLKHGMSLDDLGTLLAQHVNPKQFKPGQSIADRTAQLNSNTKRIVRTESARLVDEVNMTTYRMQDVKYVDWVTEPGACAPCLGLAETGPYLIGDAPDIPGDSHPNCRCSKVPHISIMEKRQQVAKRLGLTNDEEAGLLRWVSGDSYKLNYMLYANQDPAGLLKTTMDELDSALKKVPTYSGRIQRSVDLEGKELMDFLYQFSGNEYSAKEYLAFTKNVKAYNQDAPVQLIIEHSNVGHDLGAYNVSEGEVLYERDSKFKVLDTYIDDNDKYIVKLEDH